MEQMEIITVNLTTKEKELLDNVLKDINKNRSDKVGYEYILMQSIKPYEK